MALSPAFWQVTRVDNNDVLRRLRFTLQLGDDAVINLFALGGLTVTRELISNLLKKDDDPAYVACSNAQLATFLDGLIRSKRGAPPGEEGPPVVDHRLNNNIILRKIKIALSLDEKSILEIMKLADLPLGRSELSALFRNPKHRHYRDCQDQLLRNFLQGLQMKLRPSASDSHGVRPEELVVGAVDSEAQSESEAVLAPTPLNQIVHYYCQLRSEEYRDLLLARFLEQHNQDRAIVYVNDAQLIGPLFRRLIRSGFSAETLSSRRSPLQRRSALRTFAQGEAQVLITTDESASEIVMEGVPWAIHYEAALSGAVYIERVGRCGREDLVGRALTIFDESERALVQKVESELSLNLEELVIET